MANDKSTERFARGNYVGRKIDLLTVEEDLGIDHRGYRMLRCVCECGGNRIVTTSNFRKGKFTWSCGCLYHPDRSTVEKCPPLPHIENVELRHCYKCPGYAVGSDGSAWTCWRGVTWRPIRPCITPDGYRQVGIWNGEKSISKKVATLVAETFICPRPPGMEVCHDDGTRINDVPTNLRWGTHSENIYDAVKHGEYVRVRLGANNANAKLTDEDVKAICELHKKKTQVEMAKMFHVEQTTISRVLLRHGLKTGRSHKERTA